MKEMIKVLVVDNEPTVRAGLRMRLGLESDFAIAGEAGDGIEALELARNLQPDIVVMDVKMPRMDGITAVSQLQVAAPHIPVVMSSIHDDALTRSRAYTAGAAAFIGKQEGVELLIDTIRQVAKSKNVRYKPK